MKTIIIIFLTIFILGCSREVLVCHNETVLTEIRYITTEIEKPVIKEVVVEKKIYINNSIYKCNDSIISLTRRLKHCEEFNDKHLNETLCQFELERLNQTLNTTTNNLNKYKYNQTICIDDLKVCNKSLYNCIN